MNIKRILQALSLLCLGSISIIYFNASTAPRISPVATEVESSYGGNDNSLLTEEISLTYNDDLSIHLGSDQSVENIIDDILEDSLASLIANNSQLRQRQYIARGTELFNENWPAVPRCGIDRGTSSAKAEMTLYYDLNATPDTVNLELNSRTRNKVNIDLNLNNAVVYFKIKFFKYRCGNLRWTKELVASAGKIRVSADAQFNFSGSDFTFNSLSNEIVRSLQWPTINSDIKIVDLLAELVSEGGFAHNLCEASNCINDIVLPLLKTNFKWNEIIKPIANSAIAGIKSKISNESEIAMEGLNAQIQINLEDILLGQNKGASALFEGNFDIDTLGSSCAVGLNEPSFSDGFSSTDESLGSKYSLKLGKNSMKALAYLALQKGLVCGSSNFTATVLRETHNVSLDIKPYGDISIGSGNYNYKVKKTYLEEHPDNSSPNRRRRTTIISNGGTDEALKLSVPIIFEASGSAESNLKGVISVYFLFDHGQSTSSSPGIQLSVKEIKIESLTGSVDLDGVTVLRARDLRSSIDSYFNKFTEVRLLKHKQSKCHEDDFRARGRDLTEEDYVIENDESIYYDEITTESLNCSNCSLNIGPNIKYLDFNSKTSQVSNYQIDPNGIRLGFGSVPLFYTEISTKNACPWLALTEEERDAIDESREAQDARFEADLRPQERIDDF
ncbi:MAG: hypothetical protein HOJ35_05995 [Bdellovibrionales bacterium]|nr:hypothetical protein [Bdellovibrionales bacterium]